MEIISLCSLARGRMAVHAARAGDHLGGLGEERYRPYLCVGDARERGDRFQRDHLGGAQRNGGGSETRHQTKDPHGRHRRTSFMSGFDFKRAGSIGSVRIRTPVAAKIAFVSAGAMADVGVSPTPPGASVLFTK